MKGISVLEHLEPRAVRDISEQEAITDGFNNGLEMWLYLGKPDIDRIINKLTLLRVPK